MREFLLADFPVGQFEPGTKILCFPDSAEGGADLAIERDVVERRERMRDDEVRHERGERVGGFLPVFVDVDDDVRGREFADFLQVDGLGAADFRDSLQRILRVDAEPRPSDQLVCEAQLADQLGDRRNETDDSVQMRTPRDLRGALGGSRVTSCSGGSCAPAESADWH